MSALLTTRARWVVLLTAIAALLFDGVELGLMPVASLSVSKSLLGAAFTPTLGGDWFARFTAALMFGARRWAGSSLATWEMPSGAPVRSA